LLEFARPRPPQRAPTNLNDLTRSTLELVRYRASQAEVEIVTDYADLPSLEIDADAFGQVLLNLLTNALDAMPGGGQLRIATVVDPERVGVIVSDEGVGMDENTRGRIFQPFFSTHARSAGTKGLGLSVSLQTVESHSGTIEVESAPGRGSTFSVWLPNSRNGADGDATAAHTDSSGRAFDAGPASVDDSTERSRGEAVAAGPDNAGNGRMSKGREVA
jgi:signal transduction histidine kinase